MENLQFVFVTYNGKQYTKDEFIEMSKNMKVVLNEELEDEYEQRA